jgi:hypothetical protein
MPVLLVVAAFAAMTLACDPDDGGGGSVALDSGSGGDDGGAEPDAGGEEGADVPGSADSTSDSEGEVDSGADDAEADSGEGLPSCEGENSPCDDANPCTELDVCRSGVCQGTGLFDDGLDCTVDCAVDAFGTPVEVTVLEEGHCSIGGKCYAADEKDPTNACSVCLPSFSQSLWAPVPDGTSCDDGNPCSTSDACASGTCEGAPLFDDGEPCTLDCTIDPSTGKPKQIVAAAPDGAACDPGDGADPCLEQWTCTAGTCGGVPKDCADPEQPCIVRSCEGGSCVDLNNAADGTECDDGNPCTSTDVCAAGVCAGAAVSGETCDTGEECKTLGTCADGVCEAQPATGTPCDDGDPCTDNDTCQNGVCVGSPKVCAGGTLCTAPQCIDGACVEVALTDGTACSDGKGCTVNDTCFGGLCKGTVQPCPNDDADPCTDLVCLTDTCEPVKVPNGTTCTDGDACTDNDKCNDGTCAGTAKTCADGEVCKDGICSAETL